MIRRLGLILGIVVAAGFAGLGVVLAPGTVLGAVFLAALAAVAGYALVIGRTRPATTDPSTGEPATGGVPAADVVHPNQGHRRGVRVGVGAAVAIAAATLGLAGMGAVLGAATGPVLLLAAGGATPWFWTRLRPRIDRYVVGRTAVGRECPVEPNLATGPPPLVSALDSLSTPALCAEWQRSYHALRDAPDDVAHHHVSELRRRYLDELHRRDPDGIARWLGADSRPASTSPRRHLTGPHPTGPRPGPHPPTTHPEGTLMPEQRREGDPATEQARDTDLEPAPEHGDREGTPATEQGRRPPPAPDPDE